MRPNIGISDSNRESVIKMLNVLLSDEFVLYTKTRNYHWNIVGHSFNDLHKFFEGQYEALDEIIDEVAERSRALGGFALGSLKDFLANTRLSETSDQVTDFRTTVTNLLNDHETIICNLRNELVACAEDFGDHGTSDFLTGLMEQHEKMAWMLRAFLTGK
ncbi:DNA starvation/stationary phase protection protein [bacterium]|nr:DNA starvation/stationary phase protection protein [bacterium]